MESEEIWKKIPHYEDYQASNLGRVMNKHGKIMAPYLNGRPSYLKLALSLNPICGLNSKERQKIFPIHRLVLMAFVGIPKKGQHGLHKNDVKTDNRLENLYWGTPKDNVRDSINNGTFILPTVFMGESHPFCTHSDDTIKKIKSEYTGRRGEQTALAKKYGTTQSYISSIVLGKRRKYSEKVIH